jgi:glycosyltransferase involved in cell wall biosynthesis
MEGTSAAVGVVPDFEMEKIFFSAEMNVFQKIKNILGGKKKPRITTVINYCTNDYRFVGHCIREALVFSQEVLVPYTDHFYDGTSENLELLEKTIAENPGAKFIFFPYNSALDVLPQHWVTYARVVGWNNARADSDFILFLDADEVAEGNRFLRWLEVFPLSGMNVVKLANYYYFREPKYQAETFEDSVVLARKKYLTEPMIMDFLDRDKAYRDIPEPKARMVMGTDNTPMIHHYSWVRSREEMIKKVSTWGHSHERNWVDLVNQEFDQGFTGKDFVHGYRYKEVQPYI